MGIGSEIGGVSYKLEAGATPVRFKTQRVRLFGETAGGMGLISRRQMRQYGSRG